VSPRPAPRRPTLHREPRSSPSPGRRRPVHDLCARRLRHRERSSTDPDLDHRRDPPGRTHRRPRPGRVHHLTRAHRPAPGRQDRLRRARTAADLARRTLLRGPGGRSAHVVDAARRAGFPDPAGKHAGRLRPVNLAPDPPGELTLRRTRAGARSSRRSPGIPCRIRPAVGCPLDWAGVVAGREHPVARERRGRLRPRDAHIRRVAGLHSPPDRRNPGRPRRAISLGRGGCAIGPRPTLRDAAGNGGPGHDLRAAADRIGDRTPGDRPEYARGRRQTRPGARSAAHLKRP
jgi:hypothetical protein